MSVFLIILLCVCEVFAYIQLPNLELVEQVEKLALEFNNLGFLGKNLEQINYWEKLRAQKNDASQKFVQSRNYKLKLLFAVADACCNQSWNYTECEKKFTNY